MTASAEIKLPDTLTAKWRQLRTRVSGRGPQNMTDAIDPAIAHPTPAATPALLAGLIWELRPHTSLMSRAGPELRLGDRVATGPAAQTGAGSLLIALADALVRRDAVMPGRWLFLASHADGFWTALADIDPASDTPLRPVPGPERLHASAPEAVRAAREEAEIATIAGIALAKIPDGETSTLEDDLQRSGFSFVSLTPSRAPDLPVFDASTGLSVKNIGLGGLVLGGIALLITVVLPLVMEALKPLPPPPPAMVAVAPAPAAFGEVCTQTLAGWWPRVAGWTLVETGCALVGHLPANRVDLHSEPGAPLSVPVVVWREIRQSGRVNAVLATGAAERMLRTWNHGSRQHDTSLLLWRQVDLPLVQQDTSSVSTDVDQAIRMLSGLFAETPDAVARHRNGTVVITAPGESAELLDRATRATSLRPVRLTVPSKGDARLLLAPRSPRMVPEALFDTKDNTK